MSARPAGTKKSARVRPLTCHDGRMTQEPVRWLSDEEQVAWRAYLRATVELTVAFDRDLQVVGISLPEYELLSMLSEAGRRPGCACRSSPSWSSSRAAG